MYDAADFVECSVIGINKDYPRQFMAMFVNTYYDVQGNPGYPSGGRTRWPSEVWTTLDLSPYIHPEAKAVLLNNLFIVTPNAEPQIANLTIEFRRYGAGDREIKGNGWLHPIDEPLPDGRNLAHADRQYSGQALAVAPYTGARIPHSLWVPVNEGKVEVYYKITGPHVPTRAYYGLNVCVGGYAR